MRKWIDLAEGALDDEYKALRAANEPLEAVTAKAKAITNDPAFRAWFGDSLVFDSVGDPMPVHHSTWFDFNQFDRMAILKRFTQRDPEGIDRVGFWFTGNPEATYGPRRMDCYLRLEKPLWMDDIPGGKLSFEQLDQMIKSAGGATKFREEMMRKGHDGIIMSQTQLDGRSQDVFIVFEPNQIKSVNNRGKWDRNSDDIMESEEPVYSLDDLFHLAALNKVSLIAEEDERIIYLTWIGRLAGAQPGAGADIMKELCRYADHVGKSIMLDAMDGEAGLIRYYERFGFESDGDSGGQWVMFRDPQPSALTEATVAPEMLAPRYFHGAGREDGDVASILKNGLVPPDFVADGRTKNSALRPVKGKVYLTPELKYARLYGRHIFVVTREQLGDLQPDEDQVGQVYYYLKLKRGDGYSYDHRRVHASDPDHIAFMDKLIAPENAYMGSLLVNLAERTLGERTLRYMRDGEYIWWAKGGKALLKKMPDFLVKWLVGLGLHVAHDGPIMPAEGWELPPEAKPTTYEELVQMGKRIL